ncbi:MAG: hypothetical protein AB7K52_05980 [Phycisphaerales bacterium]
MHIVTKILAVFGAVLSVLLSALTIAFAANADALRSAVADEQSQKLAAMAAHNSLKTEAQAQNSALVLARQNAENESASLKTQLASLQSERTALMTQLQEARLNKQTNEDTATSLSATVKANQALIEALTKEIGELRDERISSARREAELVDRLNDLESQRQVLEQSTRALQEQLAEAKLAMQKAKDGTLGSAIDQPYTYTGPLIQARVVGLTTAPGGDEMAEITAGSGTGIKPNMKLSVIRDGKFIANIVITNVDAQRSVGRIDKLGREVAVSSGDLVLSRLD